MLIIIKKRIESNEIMLFEIQSSIYHIAIFIALSRREFSLTKMTSYLLC